MVFYYTTLASAFLINGLPYIIRFVTISMHNFILNIIISISVVSSVFQGGVCGLAGKFPSKYINAVISGKTVISRKNTFM